MTIKKIIAGMVMAGAVQLSWAAGPGKAPVIVTVDVRAAIMQSTEAKAKMEKLKGGLSKEEGLFTSSRTALGKLEDQYKKDAAVMSADQKRNLEKQIEDKRIELNFMGKKFQKSTQDASQELFTAMLPKFETALKAVVEENKYDMVLRREIVITSNPEFDITEEVVSRMNSAK